MCQAVRELLIETLQRSKAKHGRKISNGQAILRVDAFSLDSIELQNKKIKSIRAHSISGPLYRRTLYISFSTVSALVQEKFGAQIGDSASHKKKRKRENQMAMHLITSRRRRDVVMRAATWHEDEREAGG